MINNGYIKLHRKLINWEWYTDQNTFKLFIHCLLMANHKPNKWRGIVIDTGEFVTSLEKLSVETGMTIQQVRTSLKRLISTDEIAKKSTSQFTSIKVLKYCDYQTSENEINIPNNKRITNKQQTNNKQLTTNKNDKNDKNDKKKDSVGAFNQFILDNPEYKECLTAYKKMRVDMKKKMQPLAEKKFINKLNGFIEKGMNGIELVELAIEKNWLSVYPNNDYQNKNETKEIDVPDYMQEKKGGTRKFEKLIDDYIETVKENNTYYTYCTLWDDPMQTHKPFPNEAVGVGKTKQESIDEFMKHEQKRQDLIDTINEMLLGMKL